MAKKKPQPRHQVWLIEWFDAHDLPADRWMRSEDVRVDRRLVQSVGFLIDDDADGHTVLVGSDDGADSVTGGIVIPNVNVTARRRLH